MTFDEEIDRQQIAFAGNILTYALIFSKTLKEANHSEISDNLYSMNRITLKDIFDTPKVGDQTPDQRSQISSGTKRYSRANKCTPKKQQLTNAPSVKPLPPAELTELDKIGIVLGKIIDDFIQLTPQQQIQVIENFSNQSGKNLEIKKVTGDDAGDCMNDDQTSEEDKYEEINFEIKCKLRPLKGPSTRLKPSGNGTQKAVATIQKILETLRCIAPSTETATKPESNYSPAKLQCTNSKRASRRGRHTC